jgi:hypothetical protein
MNPRLLFPIAALLLAGQTPRGPDDALAQARERLRAMTRQLRNYACIETVDRSYYEAGSHRLEWTDRLRLEVAISRGREIHSWPGASQFDTRRAEDIVGEGPVGTGAFGTYLLDIFANPGTQFQSAGMQAQDAATQAQPAGALAQDAGTQLRYTGPQARRTVTQPQNAATGSDGGRVIFAYDFRVPLAASHYQVRAGTSWQAVEYGGSFWIDAKTLDLVRLEVRVDQLPGQSPLAAADTRLDYGRVRIGDSELILPRRSELRIRLGSGRESDNVTTFSDCREYQAESELRFDDDAGPASVGSKPAVRTELAVPLGLPLRLALDEPIDTDAAAAGDPVAARVVKPVRRAGSDQILIPADATVKGRITRAEHHLLPAPYFLLAVAFDRLERNGASSPFFARLAEGDALARELGANPPPRGQGVERWARGIFLFRTKKPRYVVPAGYESEWTTLATGPM